MMKKLKSRVEEDVKFELAEANKNYPLFASRHEGLAIIGEEVEEAKSELRNVLAWYECFKYNVYNDENDSLSQDVSDLYQSAVNVACEAIQVAAMCEKWKLGGRDDRIENLDDLTVHELIALREKVDKAIRNL